MRTFSRPNIPEDELKLIVKSPLLISVNSLYLKQIAYGYSKHFVTLLYTNIFINKIYFINYTITNFLTYSFS